MASPPVSRVPPEGPKPMPPPADDGGNPGLLSVHLAEYTALTNRVTYFISLQYLVYSVTVVALTLVAQVWVQSNMSRGFIAWSGFLLFLLLVWAWMYTVWEIFNTAAYLEGDLRHRIARLVGNNAFWGWETYLAGQRAKGYERYEWTFGLLMLLLVAIAVFGSGISRVTNVLSNWYPNRGWIIVIAYVTAMIAGRTWKVFRLQVRLKQLGKLNQASS